MLPPVDTHVHLLAGLDDGPRDMDESLAMARMLVAEGVRSATALAHQNDGYPDNTPERLLDAAARFDAALKAVNIPLHVVPTGEVMAVPDLVARYDAGQLLTYGNKGKYLLVEMPHLVFVDLAPMALQLRSKGVRIVVAHAERYPELLLGGSLVERWIAAGMLIQITAREFAEPTHPEGAKVLRDWVTRGIVHCVGTDGHRLDMRPPRIKAGMDAVRRWAGDPVADRISNVWASNIIQGRPVNAPPPTVIKKTFFGKLFGG
jgi:protein-tyrosine phosphatase